MMINRYFSVLKTKFFQSLQSQRISRQEEGISMVYLALAMAAFLSLAGLAVDGSNSFTQYRKLQTAADAAALAGARTLALNQDAAQVTSEVQTIATLNGADSAASSISNGNRNVSVTVQRNVDTYFGQWIGVNTIPVTAEAEAGFKSISGITEKLFPMTVACDCVEQNQTIVVKAPIKTYCVDDVTEYWNHTQFALWLSDFDPLTNDTVGSRSYFYTSDDTGRFTEHADGTATLSYKVKNAHGDGFRVQATLSDRQAKQPTGSPKFGPVITDATNWYYYKTLSGTLSGLSNTRYAGSIIDISRRGPAFQLGVGADYHEAGNFGGAAWLNLSTRRQPYTGVVFPQQWTQADINIQLPDCTEEQAEETETTNSCEFQWVDWNGGTATQSELADNMQDLTNSGTRHVGEWISKGVDANGGISLEVQNTIHDWLGVTFTMPLYTEGASESDQLQICGFAQMVVNSYDLEYGINRMSVQFEPAVIRGEVLSDASGDDYGVRDVVLIR